MERNQAADPQPVVDVQGDDRWMSQVKHFMQISIIVWLIACNW